MDVTTTTIDPEEAAEQLAAYRTIKAPDLEERAIIASLVVAAAGKPLVNLNDAVVGGGQFEDGCPRLAVMAPDRQWCWVARHQDGTVIFQGAPNSMARAHTFEVGGFDKMTWDEQRAAGLLEGYRDRRRTQVPLVPPQHRVRGWRTRCVILWEVEEWARHLAPRPPGDPMLLRHVIDDLYSVEAVWDLTPLEQMVLGARR